MNAHVQKIDRLTNGYVRVTVLHKYNWFRSLWTPTLGYERTYLGSGDLQRWFDLEADQPAPTRIVRFLQSTVHLDEARRANRAHVMRSFAN